MPKTIYLFVIATALLTFTACPPADTGSNPGDNSAGNTTGEASVEESVVAFDNSAQEAWKNKNGKFFDENLTDNFVGVSQRGRADKAMVVASISSDECDIKSARSTDSKVTEIAEGVAIQTGKNDVDGTCEGKDLPDSQFVTLLVKDGDKWKAAYHQTRPIEAASDDSGDGDEAEKSEGGEKPAAEAENGDDAENKEGAAEAEKPAAPPMPKFSNDEAAAEELTKLETDLWAAWAEKDTKPFEGVLADDFIELTADGPKDRAAILKQIAEHNCEIDSTGLSEAIATKVADNMYVFSYYGRATGKCDGETIPSAPNYTTTVFRKDGDVWKAVFHMGTPGEAA
ncbi:MAG: nuclear transport factor 2 family protein [Acidobacteria bacterium]|nr:MAG: nuclear transport factor 2 family protein [Acidobacteriota bacterium]REJ98199.1 MAG: nuclear transport factor 2 family protein [Acidobacteriota bacterium]REK16943.1 MAG: nuclear transport factor 2 family protein [Acidobacteriota bacterium]REK42853.1 MAG: nuclear transport factor 2 family protein [Acidobacteriota bacterium]